MSPPRNGRDGIGETQSGRLFPQAERRHAPLRRKTSAATHGNSSGPLRPSEDRRQRLVTYGLGISHGRQKTRRPDFARTVLFPSVRAFLFRFARISADLAYL